MLRPGVSEDKLSSQAAAWPSTQGWPARRDLWSWNPARRSSIQDSFNPWQIEGRMLVCLSFAVPKCCLEAQDYPIPAKSTCAKFALALDWNANSLHVASRKNSRFREKPLALSPIRQHTYRRTSQGLRWILCMEHSSFDRCQFPGKPKCCIISRIVFQSCGDFNDGS